MTTFFDVESEEEVPYSERFVWDADSLQRLVDWVSGLEDIESAPPVIQKLYILSLHWGGTENFLNAIDQAMEGNNN